MKILVTGGNSSVARHLIPHLASYAEVLTAGRRDCDIAMDLDRPLATDELPEHLDVVVHTAASFAGQTDAAMIEAAEVNVVGTLRVCQLAHEKGASLMVLVSSAFVTLPPSDPGYSAYSLTKRQAEQIAHHYCTERDIPLLIVRPSQIYGADPAIRKHQPFLYHVIAKAASQEDVTLYGNHDPRRNYIHVEDVAQALNRAIQMRLEGTFQCMAMASTSYGEVVRAVGRTQGSQSPVVYLRDKPDTPDIPCTIDPALYEALGWYPEVSLDEGVGELATLLAGHRREAVA